MKIGDVEVLITNENVQTSNTVTTRPVEGGEITDNVKQNQTKILVTGIVTKNGYEGLKKLREYSAKGSLIKYSGRNAVSNVVIADFESGHGASVKGGFTFSATLVQVKRATFQTVEIAPVVKTQVKKVSSAGRKQPVEVPVNVNVVNAIMTVKDTLKNAASNFFDLFN